MFKEKYTMDNWKNELKRVRQAGHIDGQETRVLEFVENLLKDVVKDVKTYRPHNGPISPEESYCRIRQEVVATSLEKKYLKD